MDFILIRSVLAGVSRRNPHAGSALMQYGVMQLRVQRSSDRGQRRGR